MVSGERLTKEPVYISAQPTDTDYSVGKAWGGGWRREEGVNGGEKGDICKTFSNKDKLKEMCPGF